MQNRIANCHTDNKFLSNIAGQEKESPRRGQLNGKTVQSIYSETTVSEGKESFVDHVVRIVGDPLNTISNIPVYLKSRLEQKHLREKIEVKRRAFVQMQDSFYSRGLGQEFQALFEAYSNLLDSSELINDEACERINQLQEQIFTRFDQVIKERRAQAWLQSVKDKKTSHGRMGEIYRICGLGEKLDNFIRISNIILAADPSTIDEPIQAEWANAETKLTEAYAALEEDERAAAHSARQAAQVVSSQSEPGAYLISAQEAARQGVFQADDRRQTVAQELPIAKLLKPAWRKKAITQLLLEKLPLNTAADTLMHLEGGDELPVAEVKVPPLYPNLNS